MLRRIIRRLIVLFPRVFEVIRDVESELYYEELDRRYRDYDPPSYNIIHDEGPEPESDEEPR